MDDTQKIGKEAVISSLEALTAACGEKILNPDFLLQGGNQPFAEQKQQNKEEGKEDSKATSPSAVDSTTNGKDEESLKNDDSNTKIEVDVKKTESIIVPKYEPNDAMIEPKRPTITLYSRKMKGIKDLLLAEKLNTHAISLQVTAQSTQVGGKKGRSLTHSVNYAKRCRRQ